MYCLYMEVLQIFQYQDKKDLTMDKKITKHMSMKKIAFQLS